MKNLKEDRIYHNNIYMESFEEFKDFISKRIATIRNANNISARKLSIEMGQGSEYINQIENGRKMPSMEGFYLF